MIYNWKSPTFVMRRANNFWFPNGCFRSKSRRVKRKPRTRELARALVPFSRRGLSLSIFGDLWLSLAEIYLWKFLGRKDRRETIEGIRRSLARAQSHAPGLDTVRDCVRRLVYMYAYIYVHVTLTISYTINLDFAATIKTFLPPSRPQVYPFRANIFNYPAR